jgi:hypothetical protein
MARSSRVRRGVYERRAATCSYYLLYLVYSTREELEGVPTYTTPSLGDEQSLFEGTMNKVENAKLDTEKAGNLSTGTIAVG